MTTADNDDVSKAEILLWLRMIWKEYGPNMPLQNKLKFRFVMSSVKIMNEESARKFWKLTKQRINDHHDRL